MYFNRKLFDHWIDYLIFIIFIISSLSAVSYFSSEDVFNAEISYVNNLKMPYSVILNVETLVEDNLDYSVEIIYPKENIVVASSYFSCDSNCESKIQLSQFFFDKYEIVIRTKYGGKYFEKRLNFNLKKPTSKNDLILKPTYFAKLGEEVQIFGKLILENPSKVNLVTFPIKNPSLKSSHEIICGGICDFSIPLTSEILFGKYSFQVYLPNDVLQGEFNIAEFKENQISNNTIISSNSTLKVNSTKDISGTDLFGNEVNLKVKNGSINVAGLSSLSLNNSKTSKIKIKTKVVSINSLDELDSIENLTETIVVENDDGFAKLGDIDFSTTSFEEDPNPIIYEDKKLYFRNGDSILDLNKTGVLVKNNTRKLVPGLYKQEKVVRYRDGTEIVKDNYFAYGLVSINTEKPLYHKDEIVDFLIVVLDKWGYLVSDSNITLEIENPSGVNISLNSSNLDIYETEKTGVYSASYFSDELGKYKISAYVEVDNMLIQVGSYYNVVGNYPFDIIRDVPATIDPWEGPFRNDFKITPLNNYQGEYDFVEQVSSDFEIIETDANNIETINDTTYLKWNNLNRISKPYYIAQVPLKSPILYFLGKSKIIYNSGFSNFNENRSWLFAIDPAAKVCNFNSPCICGASCTGGGEPGDGTIDSATDGNTNWEFVNDIRVTNLNGSYFGTGDTVEICVDFDCDSSGQGDRTTIGYTDTNSLPWSNADVLQEWRCDATSVVTHCVNQTLSNYVGTHHVRGKIAWAWNTENANRIASTRQYRDHDDLNFTVLERRGAYYTLWNLNNGSSIGNNLNVVRGFNLTAFAYWDKPIQDANIRHNGNGSFVTYPIAKPYTSNYTNFTFITSDLLNYPNLGIINISFIESWDKYFNLSNKTSPGKYFSIYASLKLNQSQMSPYIMYNGTQTNISCQVADEFFDIAYPNVNVSFYNNVSGYLGSDLTDSSGWANISYVENNIGKYDIICNFSSQLSDYYLASSQNSKIQPLTVKLNGTDITPPVITNVSVSPNLFSVGGVTRIKSNVTDNINLVNVYINVSAPNGISYRYPMINTIGDIYEFNFSNTQLDGNYNFFIEAFDNSSNRGFISTKTFTVTGIRTFIGIKTSKNIYKINENINLTSYIKTSTLNSSVFYDEGDSGNILYTFDSSDEWTHGGTGDQWARGVPSGSFVNQCDNSNCFGTNLAGTYNTNTNQWLESPVIDFTGRTNVKVTYWRMLGVQENGDDSLFESFDGTSWNALFQDTTVPGNYYTLNSGLTTVYPSEVEGVSNAKFRFRLVTDGGGTARDGWGVDTVNITFNPKEDWDKSTYYFNTAFGTNQNKLSAIKVKINISNYSSIGTDLLFNNNPDLEVKIYNGSAYSGQYKCNLDSTKTYPYLCEFVIKNTPEYLDAWKTNTNRNIRIDVVGLDKGDYINFSNVQREYVIPSIIENHGISTVTSILLEQFKNSTGGIVQTMNNNSIQLNASEAKQLSNYWTFSVPPGFQLGNYSAYVALTDSNNIVLQNEDDGTFINDSYSFLVQSMLINVINPLKNSVQNETFFTNLTLDTTYYNSGGWCAYELDSNGVNISMTQQSAINFDKLISNFKDGIHTIQFFCNDSDNYIVSSEILDFNVSQNPRISFVTPTDVNNSYVNRSWTQLNVSINDSSFSSYTINFDGVNYSSPNFIGEVGSLNFTNNEIKTINFKKYYSSTPIIIAIPSTDTDSDNNYLIPTIHSINSTSARVSLCEDAGNSDCSAIVETETLNYMVFDPIEANKLSWIDVGMKNLVNTNGGNNLINFGKVFSSAPYVFTQAQTYNLGGNKLSSTSWVHSITTSTAQLIGCDHPGTGNSCAGSSNEDFGYVAIDFTNADFSKFDSGSNSISNSAWTLVSYSENYTEPIIMVNQNSDTGSQDPQYPWAKNINNSNSEIRYCEQDGIGDCDSHSAEIVNWFVLEKGLIQIDNLVDYSFNVSKLLNGAYNYNVCAEDIVGNINCTETRLININKTLPEITIHTPINNSKYDEDKIIYLNVTTKVEAANVWYNLNTNLSNISLVNTTLFDWNQTILNLSRGGHYITFYANDSVGNLVYKTHYFYVLPDKDINLEKNIVSLGNNIYNISLNITNNGKFENYLLYDLIPNDFSIYNLNILNDSKTTTSGLYSGDLLTWNLSLNRTENRIINYQLNGTLNYDLNYLYLCGLD